jgi:hypothetical protein
MASSGFRSQNSLLLMASRLDLKKDHVKQEEVSSLSASARAFLLIHLPFSFFPIQ